MTTTNNTKRATLNAILDTLPHDRERVAHLRIVIRYSKNLAQCARFVAMLVRAEREFGHLHSK